MIEFFVMPKFLAILLLLFCTLSFATPFSSNASYQVCFTPGGECTAKIIAAIDAAKHQVLVQAYSFTSGTIAKALVRAQERGVQVKILFDKSIADDNFFLGYVKRHRLWFKIDALPAIAHNKIMIIDEHVVITGSFNFTVAAEENNTENVLIIDDKNLAQKYVKNWYEREEQSIKN